jgi:hypothetical protein
VTLLFELSTVLQVASDERRESANAGVDTRVAGNSAAKAPGNNTNELLGGVDKGTAAVTLARVLASSSKTSADHAVRDLSGGVVGLAGGTGNNRHIDLAEGNRVVATISGITPVKQSAS